MTNKTEKPKMKLIDEVGGFQLYRISHLSDLENPLNSSILGVDDKVKIITSDEHCLNQGLLQLREGIIQGMNSAWCQTDDGRKLNVAEVIKSIQEFREKNGPLSMHITGEWEKMESLIHPHGHDLNADNLKYYAGKKYIQVYGFWNVLVGSVPDRVLVPRTILKEYQCLSRRILHHLNGSKPNFLEQIREGRLDRSWLESQVNDLKQEVVGDFGEITTNVIEEHIKDSLDYLPFEIKQLKTQKAIADYLESRRQK